MSDLTDKMVYEVQAYASYYAKKSQATPLGPVAVRVVRWGKRHRRRMKIGKATWWSPDGYRSGTAGIIGGIRAAKSRLAEEPFYSREAVAPIWGTTDLGTTTLPTSW